MKTFIKVLLCVFSFCHLCYGEEKLNNRLPPIEFIFVNSAQHNNSLNSPLTSEGIQEAIEAGRLLKDFNAPYIVCGTFISLEETSKFMAEQMAIEHQRPWKESSKDEIGHYIELNRDGTLDTEKESEDLRDKLIQLIKDNYSHETILILVSNKNIFEFLQKELTNSKIEIKCGDVCIFMPKSNKLWEIEYRPNFHSVKH